MAPPGVQEPGQGLKVAAYAAVVAVAFFAIGALTLVAMLIIEASVVLLEILTRAMEELT
jgi:hypothetical protein